MKNREYDDGSPSREWEKDDEITHDKARQDFEAFGKRVGLRLVPAKNPTENLPYDTAVSNAAFQGYQAARAEIREKLESEGVVEVIYNHLEPIVNIGAFRKEILERAKAAITKILEVI